MSSQRSCVTAPIFPFHLCLRFAAGHVYHGATWLSTARAAVATLWCVRLRSSRQSATATQATHARDRQRRPRRLPPLTWISQAGLKQADGFLRGTQPWDEVAPHCGARSGG
eukprot:7380869-Prymnesium_polylepis.2